LNGFVIAKRFVIPHGSNSAAKEGRTTVMRIYNHPAVWVPAFLLLVLSAGCNNSSPTATPPTANVLTANSAAPSSGAAGVCPSSVVTASFSETMNAATIDDTTFTLTGPGSSAVTGQVTYDASSDTAIFTPSNPLALSTPYTATITTGAQDLFGGGLANNFVWTFTTAATACQPPAPPLSVTPPEGSAGACQNTVIAAAFPQAMNPATLNPTTFTVTGPGTTAVTGTVSADAGSKTFTFTPTSALALNTLYTATVTTGAQDTFGEALASNFVWTFTTATTACTASTSPAVLSVTPAAAGACLNSGITATFNEAMNPATIDTTTFTVAPGVTGVVTLDGTSRIATFTPSANLAASTTYTATITTGAQNPSGDALASNFVWSFTTAASACQAPVPLASAATFEVLAGSTVTSTGPSIITGGNLGLSPGSAVTGFPPGTLTPPAVMHVTDPTAAQAQLDLTTAYNYIAGLPGGAVLPGNLSGLTFTPGLYTNSSTVMLTAGNVTLDAQGNANAVFIFQIGSTLTTIGSTQVILAGGAQAKNVFWQVSSSATLGTNSIFQGNILSLQSVSLDTGATLTGRALARNGAVTLDGNTVTAP
jgi:ketosteroid isomerase-like protein